LMKKSDYNKNFSPLVFFLEGKKLDPVAGWPEENFVFLFFEWERATVARRISRA
jgi:hypothetical protein